MKTTLTWWRQRTATASLAWRVSNKKCCKVKVMVTTASCRPTKWANSKIFNPCRTQSLTTTTLMATSTIMITTLTKTEDPLQTQIGWPKTALSSRQPQTWCRSIRLTIYFCMARKIKFQKCLTLIESKIYMLTKDWWTMTHTTTFRRSIWTQQAFSNQHPQLNWPPSVTTMRPLMN